eukprot:g2603.t1
MVGKLCFALFLLLFTYLLGKCQAYHQSSFSLNAESLLKLRREDSQETRIKTFMVDSANGDCINRIEVEVPLGSTSALGFNVDCSLSLNGIQIQKWKNCTVPVELDLHRDGTYVMTTTIQSMNTGVEKEAEQNLSISWSLDHVRQMRGISPRSLETNMKCIQLIGVHIEPDDTSYLDHHEVQASEEDSNFSSTQSYFKLILDHRHFQIRPITVLNPIHSTNPVSNTPSSYGVMISHRHSPRGLSRSKMTSPVWQDWSKVANRRLLQTEPHEETDSGGDWVSEHPLVLLLIGLSLLLSLFFIGLGLYWYCTQSRRLQNMSQRRPNDGESFLTSLESGALSGGVDISGYSTIMASSWPENLKRFRYEDLWAATSGFPEHGLLGEGGFGKVYSGRLLNGQAVAVKKLETNGQQGDREFFAEVATLCRARHRNILNLLGVCIEDGNRVCVFELMDWGSVRYLLDNGDLRFTWKARVKVALGVARGLACLHESIDPPIVHQDLKSENILMDKEGEARISDFGLCTLAHHEARNAHLRRNVTRTVGTIRGTFGYLAPEVQTSGKVSTKSDVYAFGVVLLELLTGRHPMETGRPSEEQELVKWVLRGMDDITVLTEVVDPMIADNVSIVQLTAFVELAASCLSLSPTRRPSAIYASMRLEELLRFKDKSEANMIPHKINLCIESKLSDTSSTIPIGPPRASHSISEGETTPQTLSAEMEMTDVKIKEPSSRTSTTPEPVLDTRQDDKEGIFSPTSRRKLNASKPAPPDQAGPSDDLTPS